MDKLSATWALGSQESGIAQATLMAEDATTRRLTEERVAFQRQPSKIQAVAKDIAENFSCSVSEVEQILRLEMHDLEQVARIKEFVPLLAVKRVKEVLTLNRRSIARPGQYDLQQPQQNHP